MSVFIGDINKTDPKNWNDLAKAAKFLYDFYVQSVMHSALAIRNELEGPLANQPERISADIENIKNFMPDAHIAQLVYLGAKMAHIEKHPGTFDKARDIERRMNEVTPSGSIALNFINAGRGLTVTNVLTEGVRNISFVKIRLAAIDAIADGHSKALKALSPHAFKPKPETVIAAVEGELGFLPDFVRKTILNRLNPQAHSPWSPA